MWVSYIYVYINMFIYLSIDLFICLSVYSYIYLSIYLILPYIILSYLSIYRSIDLSIYLSIDLSIYRSIDLSIYRSIDLSIYRSIDLSIYLSVYLSIYLCFYVSMYESTDSLFQRLLFSTQHPAPHFCWALRPLFLLQWQDMCRFSRSYCPQQTGQNFSTTRYCRYCIQKTAAKLIKISELIQNIRHYDTN